MEIEKGGFGTEAGGFPLPLRRRRRAGWRLGGLREKNEEEKRDGCGEGWRGGGREVEERQGARLSLFHALCHKENPLIISGR